jgi:hypothetical protein
MAYVYRHIRLDTNEPFYIGIGSDEKYKRANYKGLRGRNIYWHRIVGKTDYEVDILFDEITYEEAQRKEEEFIALYGRVNNKTGILCNLTNGGEGAKGYITTEESKVKQRNAKLGKTLSEEHKANLSLSGGKKVAQLTMDGTLVKIWGSLKSIQDETGFKKDKVLHCCKFRKPQYKGFIWKYFNELYDQTKKFIPKKRIGTKGHKGCKHSEESKLKNKLAHAKPIMQFTKDDIFVKEWICATDAAKELGYKSQSKISDCCRGFRNQYMGFKWKYKK